MPVSGQDLVDLLVRLSVSVNLDRIDRPNQRINDWMNRVGIVLLIWLFLY